MTNYNNQYSAASLYDGGWRSTDRGELQREFNLTDDETKELIAGLKEIEENQ